MAKQGNLFNKKQHAQHDGIEQVNFIHSIEFLVCIYNCIVKKMPEPGGMD
jgi:hypothetical protein